MTKQTDSNKLLTGFTLLEMLVALSVFSVLAMITASLIVVLLRVQKRVEIFQNLQDNIRFSMDFMNRSLLSGRDYRCISASDPIPNLATLLISACNKPALLYLNQDNKLVAYRMKDGAIETWTEGALGYVRMTDPRVTITKIHFYVQGGAANDKQQPRVTILIRASVPDPQGGVPIVLDLETTASQRIIDS